MRVLVLVNGEEGKTDAVRVRELFRDLARQHDVTYLCRDNAHKVRSLLRFSWHALTAGPDTVYVGAVAVAGVGAAWIAKVCRGSRLVISTGDDVTAFGRSHFGWPKA